jgi:hypothetical protein
MSRKDDDPFLRQARKTTLILAPKRRSDLLCKNVDLSGTDMMDTAFCINVGCKNLIQRPICCRYRKTFGGRLDLRPKHTTLRNRGTSHGYFYRNV